MLEEDTKEIKVKGEMTKGIWCFVSLSSRWRKAILGHGPGSCVIVRFFQAIAQLPLHINLYISQLLCDFYPIYHIILVYFYCAFALL